MAGQRILVVEDEVIINEDIQSQLQRMGYRVVGAAYTQAQAEHILATTEVDMAILDIHLSSPQDGLALAGFITQRYQLPFIFLTSYSDFRTVTLAKQTRPGGYLVKPFRPDDLFTALEIAWYNHQEKNQTLAWSRAAIEAATRNGLTDREYELLPGLFEGLTYYQLADEYNISVNTVKTHLKHIFEKLEVNSKVELIKKLTAILR